MSSPREGISVMADPGPRTGGDGRFDYDEIYADGQLRRRSAVRQAVLEQPTNRGSQMLALAVVEGLFRQPEVAPGPPSNLDDDESRRWTRVDRHQIDLMTTEVDVPSEDEPACFDQPIRNQSFGGIARLLGRCSRSGWTLAIHATIVAAGPAPALYRL